MRRLHRPNARDWCPHGVDHEFFNTSSPLMALPTCRIRCVLIYFGTAFPTSPSPPSSSRGIAGLMIARIRPPLAWDNQWKGGQSGVIDTVLMYSCQCVNRLLASVILSVGNRPWCPLMDYTRSIVERECTRTPPDLGDATSGFNPNPPTDAERPTEPLEPRTGGTIPQWELLPGGVKHDKNVSNVSFRKFRICDRHRQTARGDFESVEQFGLGDLVSCKVGSSSSDRLGSKYLIDSEWTYDTVRDQKRPCQSRLTYPTPRHFFSRPFHRTSRAVRLDCHKKKGLLREMPDQSEPTGSTSSCKGPPTVRRRGGRGYCGRAQAGFAYVIRKWALERSKALTTLRTVQWTHEGDLGADQIRNWDPTTLIT